MIVNSVLEHPKSKVIRHILSLASAFALVLTFAHSSMAAPALSGLIVDQSNKPISGVQIIVTQMGKQVATQTTSADGSYKFDLNSGAYSLQLIPPAAGYSRLNAYDLLLPSQPITFILTPPTPGRSFVTGHVTLPKGFNMATDDTSVGFGDFGAKVQDNTGYFKIMPTAGSTGSFGVSGKLSDEPLVYKMVGTTPMTINQDTMLELRVPLYRQRIRVMTASGIPVAGASIFGGSPGDAKVGNQPMVPIEGLGNFVGNWDVLGMKTDANGYVSLPALAFSGVTPARFDVAAPATYKYQAETFNTKVGGGDVTLTLTKPISSLTGTVRDLSGKPFAGAVVSASVTGVSGGGGGSDANGKYLMSMAPNDNYSLSMSIPNDTVIPNFYKSSWASAPNFAFKGDSTLDLVMPVNNTRIRVLDSNGQPVTKAYVSIKPKSNSFTDYTGAMTIISGKKPLNVYFYSFGYTDSNGYVTLPTMKLDAEVDGDIYADNGLRPNLSWVLSNQKIGLGKDVTVTLISPTINLSGSSRYQHKFFIHFGKFQSWFSRTGCSNKRWDFHWNCYKGNER